jgi:peptidoglycan/xylan/chitin deacetylase (PgdA/CDA1 family)
VEVSQPKKFLKSSSSNEITKILFQENILVKKEKALSDYKKLTIQHFLAQRNLLKENEIVTVVNMKEILKKLKEKVVNTKRDGLLALFFDKIIHLDFPIFN